MGGPQSSENLGGWRTALEKWTGTLWPQIARQQDLPFFHSPDYWAPALCQSWSVQVLWTESEPSPVLPLMGLTFLWGEGGGSSENDKWWGGLMKKSRGGQGRCRAWGFCFTWGNRVVLSSEVIREELWLSTRRSCVNLGKERPQQGVEAGWSLRMEKAMVRIMDFEWNSKCLEGFEQGLTPSGTWWQDHSDFCAGSGL